MHNYGDITKINGADVPIVNVITGGSPCQDLSVAGARKGLLHEDKGDNETTRSGLFMDQVRIVKEMRQKSKSDGEMNPRYMVWENVCFGKDTLVTCETGYKKITEISIGEKVKTLSGRYMPVIKTYKHKDKEVITLKVSGGEDLTVTPNHPFWAREKIYNNSKRIITNPQWIPAGELTKNHLIGYVLDIPTLPDNFISHADAWTIGRWLADGSVDLTKSNPRIFISCGLKKAETTRIELAKTSYEIYENKPHETAINFSFTSRDFYSLIKDCNKGAANKKIPQYIFNLPIELQKSVLDGYISGDGFIRTRGKGIELSASTASRELAYGIARLIRNVYHVLVNISITIPKNVFINGRKLNVNHPSYNINCSLTSKVTMGYYENGIMWQPVKEIISEGKKETVYNLSVLEDNTYAANDVIGHNCGAFSSNKGEDFRCVLEEIAKISDEDAVIPEPPKGKWPYAGLIVGDGWSIAYRVHDAQYWGVPQRRRRLCVLFDGNGQSAGHILFELWRETNDPNSKQTVMDTRTESRSEIQSQSESLCGDSESCRTSGKGTSEDSEGSFDTSSRAISFQERAGCAGGGQRNPNSK